MTDFDEIIRHNLEEDWGPAASHSEYQIGDTIRYQADGGVYSGTIIWVAAPRESRIEGHDNILPTRYITTRTGWDPSSIPDVAYSSDILQSTDEEVTLVPCKFCGGHHYRGQEQYCDHNPNKP